MIITQAGLYKLDTKNKIIAAGEMAVYLSGSLGGGTAVLAYIDDFGNTVNLIDGAIVEGEQKIVHQGYGVPVHIVITGGSVNVSVLSGFIK